MKKRSMCSKTMKHSDFWTQMCLAFYFYMYWSHGLRNQNKTRNHW